MINEKGLQPPAQNELDAFGQQYPELSRWMRLVVDGYPKVNTYEPSLNVASVAANSESVQTFTVNGLTVYDVVEVNKPGNDVGLDMVQYWVSDADELSLKFRNHTGSPIDPAAADYRVIAIRL